MKSKVAGFYAARSRTIPPLPWPTFAPPFSNFFANDIATVRSITTREYVKEVKG